MRVMPLAAAVLLTLLSACTETATKEAPLSAEARGHLERMAAEAAPVVELLKARRDTVLRTPEFLQLQMDWDEKLYDCRIRLQSDLRAKWAADRVASANAMLRDVQSRRTLDAGDAAIAMAQYAATEALLLQSEGADKEKRSLRIDMASQAAHVLLSMSQADASHPQTIAWRTLKGKWLWRAANGAIATALEGMSPGKIANEWIATAKGMESAAAGSSDGAFIEQFGVARMQSVKAAMENDDKAVAAAGMAMTSAAEAGVAEMERPDFVLTPENLAIYLDWSHKVMESDALVHRDAASRRAAVDAQAARVRRMQEKMAAMPDELLRHMLKYAEAEADYQRALVK